jgi:hypothetical protein
MKFYHGKAHARREARGKHSCPDRRTRSVMAGTLAGALAATSACTVQDVGAPPAPLEADREAVAPCTDPAVCGQWSPGIPLLMADGQPLPHTSAPMHTALLRSGKVLFHRFTGAGAVPPVLYDVWTGAFEAAALPGMELVCGAASLGPDGSLIATGGSFPGGPGPGHRQSWRFDPGSQTWSQLPDMPSGGRWYPSSLSLGDGRTMLATGLLDRLENGAPVVNPSIEIYDPASNAWTEVARVGLPLYAYMHLLPTGEVAFAGPQINGFALDPNTGGTRPFANSSASRGAGGTSILIPPSQNGVVMNIGGGEATAPTATTEILDARTPGAAWRPGPSLSVPRQFANAVVMADGKVLVVGGISDGAETPVLHSEILDPANEAAGWMPVAAQSVPRGYHSTAMLLPDGSVLSVGGDTMAAVPLPGGVILERYLPPYMFRPVRPIIYSFPNDAHHGDTIEIRYTVDNGECGTAPKVDSVALVTGATTTHALNMSQRYLTLEVVSATQGCEDDGTGPGVVGTIQARLPASTSVLPLGYHMIFIKDAAGTPSHGEWLHVHRPEPGE